MMTSGFTSIEHLDDVVVVGAPARMRHHGGRCGVLDLGVGDDADRHAAAALDEFGNGSRPADDPSVFLLQRAIDAERVDAGFVTGRVGAHAVGAVGDDRVACRRSRPAPCAACRRSRARRRSGLRRGPSTSMRAAVRCATDRPSPMNRMTFLAFGLPPVSKTSQVTRALALAGGGLDRVGAGLGERGVADPVGRMSRRRPRARRTLAGLPSSAAASSPLMVTRTADCAGAPGNSTLRSNLAPARISALSSG